MKKQKILKSDNSCDKSHELKQKKTKKSNYHWPFDLEPKNVKKSIGFALIFIVTVIVSNPINAQVNSSQGLSIRGTVTDEDGPLLGVNIIQKGAEIGTTTDENGKFSFPKPLKPNDVLVFTYLGYETQEISITKETTNLNVVLVIDSIVMRGALEIDTSYKSKRTQ